MDAFELISHKNLIQLKKSKDFSNDALNMKEFKRETKEDKQIRMLREFDINNLENHMKLSNFLY